MTRLSSKQKTLQIKVQGLLYACIVLTLSFSVQLVEISSHDVLVDVNRISKRTPTDLVELAVEIQKVLKAIL